MTLSVKQQRDPLRQLESWYRAAIRSGYPQPEAMTLATATSRGAPSARIVLFKGIIEGEIFFVSNYDSRKGREIEANPRVALVFVWLDSERQIRVEGRVRKSSVLESEKYWASRSRDSQLSAMVSAQSETVVSRDVLENRVRALAKKYRGRPLPRPKHWGGYRITPMRIEFWQGRPHRLHDRLVYLRGATSQRNWKVIRLSP